MNPDVAVEFLNDCHNTVADCILEIQVPDHPIKMLKVALALSLIEALGAMLTLIETKRYIGVTIVFRTFLETYVELKNLVRDNDFYDHAMFQYYKDEVQRFESSKGGNRFLKSLTTLDNFEARLETSKEEKRKLARKGIKGLQIKEKFALIAMEDEYNSIYKFLCSEAHNDLRSLNSRHFKEGEKGKAELVLYKNVDLERFLPELDATAVLLLDAALIILQEFKTDKIDLIKDLQKEYAALTPKP